MDMTTKNRDFAACERALIEEQQQGDALRAENERLRAHVAILTEEGHCEIERLRAAALRILDALDDGVPTQEEIEAFRTALDRPKE